MNKKRIFMTIILLIMLGVNALGEKLVSIQGDFEESPVEKQVPYSVELVSNGEEKPLTEDKTTEGMKQNRRTDVIYRNRIKLENNKGLLWAVVDPVTISPKLNITSERGEIVPGMKSWFKIYTNYSEFIRKWEIDIYVRGEDTPFVNIKGTDIDFSKKILWTAPKEFFPGDEIEYKVKVWDGQGNFDETSLKSMDVVTKERWEKNTLTDEKGKRKIEGGEIYGRNSLLIHNIPLDAAKVRFYGRDFDEDMKLYLGKKQIPIDKNGKFAFEEHFSPGAHILDLRIIEKEEIFHYPLEIEVPDKYNFIVGIADVKSGKYDVSGNDEILSKDYHYDESFYTDGRVAFYSKNRYKKYLLTAHMDTREEELKNIFNNLDERDNRSVFRDMQRDMYYTTYGDESTTYSDVNTQGKLYLRLEWDKNNFIWGNYNTGFTGTEFANYNRSLYGAKLDLRSRKSTSWGEDKNSLKAFISQPGTIFAHDSFLGTGGSLYYLKHTDMVVGSEKIWVEIKDKKTGLVVENLYLTGGEDYEIEYFQGRIILSRPLMQIVRDGQDATIIKDDALDGKEAYLRTDYEFYSTGIVDDDLSGGIRGGTWFNEGIYAGGTYVEGNDNDLDYTLKEADVIFRKSKDTFLRLELAESEGRQSGSKFYSDDGGLSFREIKENEKNQSGKAYSVKGKSRLSDLNQELSDNVLAEGWYRKKEKGFSTSSLEDDREELNFGTKATYEYSKKLKLKFYYDHSETVTDEKEEESNLGTAIYYRNKKLLLSTELKGNHEEDTDEKGDGFLGGIRGEYFFAPSTSLYTTLQGTLYKDGDYETNDMITLGGKVKLGDKLRVDLESSKGSRGDSVQAGLDYSFGQNHDVYVNYLLSEDEGERGRSITFGQRAKMGERYNVYQENQFVNSDSDGSGFVQSYGLDFDATEKLRTGISYQQGDLEKEDDTIRRRSVSLYSSYDARVIFLRNKLEYRRDKGQDEKKHQWLTANRLKYIFNNEWTLQGKGNFSYTEDEISNKNDAKFAELSIGAAYRPVWSDRLNIISKYTYLYDLPSEGQDDAASDEKAHIFAVEEIYDLNEKWSLGGKVAYKKSMLREGRDDGDWFSNSTELYAVKALYHIIKKWDIMGEHHWLISRDAEDMSQGYLVSVQYHVNNNMKVGVGYNFTSFDDDLTKSDYDAKGWFVNFIGKL
jgi:hypothetical protein